MESIKHNPTPAPTVSIKTHLFKAGNLSAKTIKSGSAIVIKNPTRNELMSNNASFFFDINFSPRFFPIGIIEISAPNEKRLTPNTKKTKPIINAIKSKRGICKKAKFVMLNCGGELFVSKHLKKLVNEIIKVNPDVKFLLITNGLLASEKTLKDFNLYDKIATLSLSIHAASKKTYEKIVRGGKWDVLQKNLKYISKLKKEGKIKTLEYNFVVHSLNFKEMPKFVKMAKKFGATPTFWRFRKWSNEHFCASKMNKTGEYEKYSVWEKDHKDYRKFLKVMKKLKRMNVKILFYDPLFQKLYNQQKDTWFDKIKNFIFRDKNNES